MKDKEFLLSIVKKIESIRNDIISYGCLKGDKSKKHMYWQISVSDYTFYSEDKRFLNLCKAWRQMANKRGFKIVFICGWIPKEEELMKLAEDDNLILNV